MVALFEVCCNLLFFRYVNYIRAAQGQDPDGPVMYITAMIWAEMKKSASYKVDISFGTDAVVREAQCECGAGQGPNAHCKHVGAVLYGLSCYCETGDVVTALTCTQVYMYIYILSSHL